MVQLTRSHHISDDNIYGILGFLGDDISLSVCCANYLYNNDEFEYWREAFDNCERQELYEYIDECSSLFNINNFITH